MTTHDPIEYICSRCLAGPGEPCLNLEREGPYPIRAVPHDIRLQPPTSRPDDAEMVSWVETNGRLYVGSPQAAAEFTDGWYDFDEARWVGKAYRIGCVPEDGNDADYALWAAYGIELPKALARPRARR